MDPTDFVPDFQGSSRRSEFEDGLRGSVEPTGVAVCPLEGHPLSLPPTPRAAPRAKAAVIPNTTAAIETTLV